MRINRFSVTIFIIIFLATVQVWAQNENTSARNTQWSLYAMPTGEYTRYVNKTHGYSLWRPSDWPERNAGKGNAAFGPSEQEKTMMVVTEPLPEGYGVANYVTSLIQEFRKQPIDMETVSVRHVLLGGVEAREITVELDSDNGQTVFQTYWVTQVGATGFAFVFSAPLANKEKLEPYFKRLILTVRFHTAGHWDEDFETLRTKFPTANKTIHDATATQISEALRTAKMSGADASNAIAELAAKAPESVLEMLTDYDPNVRAATLMAIGKSSDARWDDALIWALTDNDAFSSNVAAQMLVTRGATVLPKIKSQLSKLVKNEGALLRYAARLNDESARDLAEELLKSNERSFQLNGLQMAILLPLKGLKLPYAKLFTTDDVSIISHTLEAIRLRHVVADEAEFVEMIGTDAELWAAHALGEIGAPAIVAQLQARKNILDARYQTLLKGKGVMTVRGNSSPPPLPPPPMPKSNISSKKSPQFSPPREIPKGVPVKLPPFMEFYNSSPASTPPALFKTETELTKLWSLTSELDDAVNKIKWREQWAAAKNEDERKKILAETKENPRLNDWAKVALRKTATANATVQIDFAKLKNAATTGATIFPEQTTLYLTAPNFEETINKLDAALTGIQMGTVRDQMTFALMLNGIKAQLANKMNLALTGSATSTLGIDLRAPVSMATWADKENTSAFMHSALILRVTDRARFERTMTMYQADFGDFDTFVPIVSAGARFASITPAILPLVFYSLASVSDFAGTVTKTSKSKNQAAAAFFKLESAVYAQQEKIGDIPVTVFEKLRHVGIDATTREAIYVAYLGETAVIASSREALLDALDTTKAKIAENKSYNRIKAERGEMIYFSQLNQLLNSLFSEVSGGKKEQDAADTVMTAAMKKAFSAETGAMRLSQNSWESIFHVPAADADFMQTLRAFKATDLTAPRDLLPKSTLFYAATVFDPTKFSSYMEKLDAEIAAAEKAAGKEAKSETKKSKDKMTESIETLQKLLLPHLQGEVSIALLSVANLFKDDSFSPSFAITLKLKNDTLAKTARSGLTSFVFKRVPDATVLNVPVFKLSDEKNSYVAAITEQYFIVADSVESLRLLEGKEKFADVRDFARPASIAPEKLAFFSTYNIDAAFAEARALMSKGSGKADKDDNTKYFIDAMSAWSHAFHSQRMLLAFADEKNLEGQLGVSFDREGNFNVGAMSRKEFDLENALITPKGVNITKPTQVESLRIKVAAKQPGVIARVQEDLSKFSWHKIEPEATATSLIFSTSQRRIPDNLTIKLPVKGAGFEPYLTAHGNINSNAPEIVKLAKEIAGKEKDGRKIATKIGQWTYENLKWKRVTSTTVQTLATREADCLEHAELYTALARSLGLPARVVSGAAFSGGNFGAHAWVEIYLGEWVEVDPTWGLMDHVDATHLRFDGNGFISYAQLNQVDFEILAARSRTIELQRDPVKLVKNFAAEKDTESQAAVFDLELTAVRAFGADVWAKQTLKQRAALTRAFNKTVAMVIDDWGTEWDDNPLILTQEIKQDQATLDTIVGNGRLRFSLTARNGVWYVTEIENVDEAAKILAEPLQALIAPTENLAVIRNLQNEQPEQALKHLEKIIAAHGETAPLLLVKAEILAAQDAKILAQQTAKETTEKITPDEKSKAVAHPQEALTAYRQIAKRWPDYAPGQYALGQACATESANYPEALQAFQQYAKLTPLDPRPWREMSNLYVEMQRPNEAENALRQVLARDRENINSHISLVAFLLGQSQMEKAKESLAAAFQQNKDANSVLNALDWQVLHEPDETSIETAQQFEKLVLSFPTELANSEDGWRGLSEAQRLQKKYDAAIKSLHKVVALVPDGGDQATIASIYRETKRYAQALTAANLAIKQDAGYARGHFEQACALALLGRKREALAALKKSVELNPDLAEQIADEKDLQVLTGMAEFKALLPKEEATGGATEIPSEQSKTAKP